MAINFISKLRRLAASPVQAAQLLSELVRILNEQTALIKQTLDGSRNQNDLVNERQRALEQGLANQTELLNDRLKALEQGLADQTDLLNERQKALEQGLSNQTELLRSQMKAIEQGVANQSTDVNQRLDTLIDVQRQQLSVARRSETRGTNGTLKMFARSENNHHADQIQMNRSVVSAKITYQEAMQRQPLLRAENTYNTEHPEYDAGLVRNYPGRILNSKGPNANIIYADLKKMAEGKTVPEQAWNRILEEAMEEARAVPHAEEVFERQFFMDRYITELNRQYPGHYSAGWVGWDDACLLYWLVRRLDPAVIVQTGVSNGLSSAFMMLALAQNGTKGKLYAIDQPRIFDSRNSKWTAPDTVYSCIIPKGKTSGWLVPEAYRDRFEVQSGDAKELLPELVDRFDSIDIFYHDSDHSYQHMMFEFNEVKRRIKSGGLIVADDVNWSSSLWDFADQQHVPGFNFKGKVGMVFF